MKRILIAILMLAGISPAFSQNAVFRPLTFYKVTATTALTSSNSKIGTGTNVVRALCDVTCYVATGVTTANSALTVPILLAPGREEYFKVPRGAYVRVLSLSGSGNLYITEME